MAAVEQQIRALIARGAVTLSGKAHGGAGRSFATLDGQRFAYDGGRVSKRLTEAVSRTYAAIPAPPEDNGPVAPYVFRDRRGLPVATNFEDFPARVTRGAADSFARRKNVTRHPPPQGVEPYSSAWGTPVILVAAQHGGAQLSQTFRNRKKPSAQQKPSAP